MTRRCSAIVSLLSASAIALAISPGFAFANQVESEEGAVAIADDSVGAIVDSSLKDGSALGPSFVDGSIEPSDSLGSQDATADGLVGVGGSGSVESPNVENSAANESSSKPDSQSNVAGVDSAQLSDLKDGPVSSGDASNSSSASLPTAGQSEQASSKAPATPKTASNANDVATPKVAAAPKAAVKDVGVLGDGNIYKISTAVNGGYVVDVAGASRANGTNVQLYESNRTLAQYWQAHYLGNGWYRLSSLLGEGYFLGYSSSAKQSSNVMLSTSTGDSTKWRIDSVGSGLYGLIPYLNSKMRLDLSGASATNSSNLQLYSSNGTKAQKYSFTLMKGLTDAATNGASIDTGVVMLSSALASNKYVDVSGGSYSSGANVQLYSGNASLAQKYTISTLGYGVYSIKSALSNKALDVSGGAASNGANIQVYVPNNTLAQFWYFVKSGSGYSIRNVESSMALDVAGASSSNGTNIQVYKANGTNAQKFNVVSSKLIENGTYVMQSAVVGSMVLDVAGGTRADGGNVQIYRSNGTNAQKFKITYLGGNQYSIVNANSGKYLDVAGASKANGANIQQYAGNGTNAQKWIAVVSDNGGLMFKSAASGKYIDISGASTRFSTNVQQYSGNGTNAQRFYLQDANWSFYNGVSSDAMKIINKAEQYEGWPYEWGGRSPATSFDCAGLVMWCANSVWGTGFDLMYTNAETLYSYCMPISESQAKPGDLVFYRGTYGSNLFEITHVVIYCGNGVMYGAGDPIGYAAVDCVKNFNGRTASRLYARVYH